ncbi:MAG: hypothetical protein FWC41_00970 [Firmicutes bacterium]|nr:hypothetical protein [Bacillota bacterium]
MQYIPSCFQQFEILDVSNLKISYIEARKSNVLVIGEGKKKKFFKEKYILTNFNKTIEFEIKRIFKDSPYLDLIQEEFSKILEPVIIDLKCRFLRNFFSNLRKKHSNNCFIANIFSAVLGKITGNMRFEIYENRFLNHSLDFFKAISEIRNSQQLSNLDDFEKICKRKYRNLEFSEEFCNIPFDKGQDLTIRNLATSKMAKLLKIESLIANSICVKLQMKNCETLEGILMDLAEGINLKDDILKNKTEIKITPSMQKNLTSLQIFDSICGQCDRVAHNYNIITNEKGEAVGLCAFDNDWSFSLDTDMQKGRTWLPPIIDKNGKIKLPHIDIELANNVLLLNDEIIKETLTEILDEEYIIATQNRVKQIQKAIKLSISCNEKFLLNDNEWNNETIQEELTGGYSEPYSVETTTAVFGRTYLKLLSDSLNRI